MSPVDETKALWRRSRFAWGRTDCLMSVADHVFRVTGRDPAARWRGCYDTEDAARSLLEAYGGTVGIMEAGLAGIGIRHGARAYGAPVVCDLGGEHVAGLDAGARIIFMAEGRGMIETRAPVVRAWPI